MSRPACFAAAAWIHGGDQLKTRRIGDVMVGSGDDRLAGLKRLTQGFQDTRLKLRKLVEKEHAQVGERHLARSGADAAADEGRRTCRVVGRAKGSAAGEPSTCQ